MIKDSLGFVFVVIGRFVVDDEEDLEFVNKFDALHNKTKK